MSNIKIATISENMPNTEQHANNEDELQRQLEDAKTDFLNEKPHPTLMIARLMAHSVTDATAMIYFESIQELMQMDGMVPSASIQQLNDSLLTAMKNYPAIVLCDTD